MAFNWTCPFCGRPQTVTNSNHSTKRMVFETLDSNIGVIAFGGEAIVCSNPDCQRPSITVQVLQGFRYSGGTAGVSDSAEVLLEKRLIPESYAKPQPEIIPQPLRDDYHEACLIRDLSPKASATLSRRCLQGMIRDFCGIKESTLFKEIEKLRKLVDDGKAPTGVSIESVEAIDQVRNIGNIGAHMEKDIDLIIPVEPAEAQILIELIEDLFADWYVARHQRQERLGRLAGVALEKKKLIEEAKTPQIEGPKTE